MTTVLQGFADALAEALDEALATLDPDGDDHPDLLIPLQQYRLYGDAQPTRTALSPTLSTTPTRAVCWRWCYAVVFDCRCDP